MNSLLHPGTILGRRYRLDSELGRGGMGVVFRATDLELRREVAIKVLTEAARVANSRERLLHEARAAAALNHPHIVTVFDLGEDQGVPFFVMELVDGPTLGEARPTDCTRIAELACQVCEALDHAHASGLVHRDLKPANVLLAGGGRRSAGRAGDDDGARLTVKLADLGLALAGRDSERITDVSSIVGTVAYMAPEQALGQDIDGRADLYSLGVLLYECLAGRLPFDGDHPLAIVSQHIHAPVVPPRAIRPAIPPALEAVVLRLLAKDPAQRFDTALDVKHALEQAMADPETLAARDTTGSRPDGAMVSSGADEADGPGARSGGDSTARIVLLDALARGQLVGREQEFGEVRELWRRARAGAGHCVLVSGEPGAGKTRLARELLVAAAVEGAAVLHGGCYEFEATTPYLPFVEAFRRWVRAEGDDTRLRAALGDAAGQIARIAPEIDTRLGGTADRAELPPHEERLLFFDAVARTCRAIARRQGLLFYIDDLHWADASSLSLLGHLLRTLREERVLFAASYRETELDRTHPLSRALVEWNRDRLTTRIPLRRFGPRQTRAQLAALLGEEVSEEFTGAVHRETEGNPFFVEEVLKALIETGSVRRESGHWTRDPSGELVIPQSMKEAIGQRLDRVGAETNEVLRAAAVLGKTFAFRELAAAAGDRGEDALLDALDEAVRAQLLLAGDGETFTFTHDKIREVLYEELNPIRRRRLHRRIAEALEGMRDGVAVERLAHHCIEAGDHERGLEYAKQAGAEAARVFAFDETLVAYGRALECAEALNREDERIALEEAMGNACLASGNHLPAAEHFERATALERDPGERARLQCAAAASLVTTGHPRALELVGEALRVLDPATQPFDTANALSTEARVHHLNGRHRDAAAILERAAALVAPHLEESSLDPAHCSVIARIYSYTAGAYQHLGRFDDADEWARRSFAIGEARGIPMAQAVGLEFLGENAIGRGDWRAGVEHAAREREIAIRIQSRDRLGWTHFITSICLMLLGDLDAADREATEGIAIADSIGESRLGVLLRSVHSNTLVAMGRHDEALRLALEVRARAEEMDLLFLRTEAHHALAMVHHARGEPDAVLEHCEAVLRLTAGSESCPSRLWSGPLHVETLLALGRHDEARARCGDYAALVAGCQTPYFQAEAARLGRLCGLAGGS